MYQVLIAEDEVWIRSALTEMIERLDAPFTVVAGAANGEEAWRLLNVYWPNIVITDIMMPEKDGLWLVEQIYDGQLPVVSLVLSGYDNFQYARQAMRYGVTEYMLKPVDEEELLGALNRSLKKLEGLADAHGRVVLLQRFLDRLPELDQQTLMREQSELLEQLNAKTAHPAVGRSLIRMLSVKWNALLQEMDPQFVRIPFPCECTDEKIHQHTKELAEHWIRSSSRHLDSAVKASIKKASDYLQKHFKDEVSLSVVAGHVHMSVSYFSMIFKKTSGVSFVQYINQLRLNEAKSLLLNPELKIYEVAELSGFVSLPYFNRTFKQMEGLSPGDYRKRMGIWT
ncbi:response regulator [Paenibacillus cremeus]|uniref:Helix-turn-helix domain-containing protein n=1 Tax=Paenibacillus cremeus TaxID=2163881 RepID=A0A559KGR4_9BACL|nr:response regulator [Paenibacillus cremeus]TVY11312.1 helix-turn-helix domain-containing protein [Paenibacillus cremeus]